MIHHSADGLETYTRVELVSYDEPSNSTSAEGRALSVTTYANGLIVTYGTIDYTDEADVMTKVRDDVVALYLRTTLVKKAPFVCSAFIEAIILASLGGSMMTDRVFAAVTF
ncbi:hypothetical protein EXIGLDRAFT_767143 [Exidia glandulosa HHB12029]|uniref:Uncharacterized protein n=1 Tax=Exidia glandulosa HHB12029 TaxID=1314781 RepID=A0A165J6E7_EXIGL|nr:hypothetical protein EXIGLDRAFT_767143 [Exidia glandulosa HHB12029]